MQQYYGINSDGDTVYVAMSKQGVVDYAEKHPDEDIIQIEDKNPGKCVTINLNNSAIKLVCCEHSPSMIIIDDDTGSKKIEIEEIANQISFNTLYNRILNKMMLKHSV